MPRVQYQKLSEEEKNELLKKFYSAIVSLNSYTEVANFFKDLLQADETVMLARRLKIAEFLEEDYTYDDIASKMKVGTNTIAKVNHWRQFGKKGYQNVVKNLKRLEEREEGRRIQREKLYDPLSWASFEKKYNLANKESIDLIILDVIMPNMDGPRAFKEIQKIKNVPVLFASGYAESEEISKLRLEGNLEFIQKPFLESALFEQINKLMK